MYLYFVLLSELEHFGLLSQYLVELVEYLLFITSLVVDSLASNCDIQTINKYQTYSRIFIIHHQFSCGQPGQQLKYKQISNIF